MAQAAVALPRGPFSVILSDPPWSFRDKCRSGKRGAGYKYQTMNLREICALPVREIVAPDAFLFLWVPASLLAQQYEAFVAHAWGFDVKTVAFVWRKLSRTGRKPHFGMGHHTRQDAEFCMLGVRGHPKVASHSVRQVIEAPVREHSRKPCETFSRIEQLCGDVPRVELFSRQRRPGWTSWGLEVDKFEPLEAVAEE